MSGPPAVKIAYKTVNIAFFTPAQHPADMVESRCFRLMLCQLEPYWADFHASGSSATSVPTWPMRGEEVSEALLSVTDSAGGGLRAASDRQGQYGQGPPSAASTSRPRLPCMVWRRLGTQISTRPGSAAARPVQGGTAPRDASSGTAAARWMVEMPNEVPNSTTVAGRAALIRL